MLKFLCNIYAFIAIIAFKDAYGSYFVPLTQQTVAKPKNLLYNVSMFVY